MAQRASDSKERYKDSGTHVIRHTISSITRKSLGLDAAQAILRHTSSRMSEEYAKLDVDKKVLFVVTQASDLLKQSQKERPSSRK